MYTNHLSNTIDNSLCQSWIPNTIIAHVRHSQSLYITFNSAGGHLPWIFCYKTYVYTDTDRNQPHTIAFANLFFTSKCREYYLMGEHHFLYSSQCFLYINDPLLIAKVHTQNLMICDTMHHSYIHLKLPCSFQVAPLSWSSCSIGILHGYSGVTVSLLRGTLRYVLWWLKTLCGNFKKVDQRLINGSKRICV